MDLWRFQLLRVNLLCYFVLETNNKINWTVTAQLFRILKWFNFSRTWTWKFVALRPLLENLSCFVSGIREVSSYLRCNLPWPASNIPGALRLLRLVPPCCLTSITKWTQCCIDVIWKFNVMSRSNVTLKHTRSIFYTFFFGLLSMIIRHWKSSQNAFWCVW